MATFLQEAWGLLGTASLQAEATACLSVPAERKAPPSPGCFRSSRASMVTIRRGTSTEIYKEIGHISTRPGSDSTVSLSRLSPLRPFR